MVLMDIFYDIHKTIDWNSEILRSLDRCGNFAIEFEGVYKGVTYQNMFTLDQLDIRFSNEINEMVDEVESFNLEKPLCVLYKTSRSVPRSPTDGALLVEFQIVVNTEPQGILNLEGFCSLIRAVCNPKRSKSYWMPSGLAPRIVEEAETIPGKELLEKLQGRILLRSIITTFDILGESVYG